MKNSISNIKIISKKSSKGRKGRKERKYRKCRKGTPVDHLWRSNWHSKNAAQQFHWLSILSF